MTTSTKQCKSVYFLRESLEGYPCQKREGHDGDHRSITKQWNDKGELVPLTEPMPGAKVVTRRGFAALTPERRREIASMGGKIAHETGKAHQFNHDEAVAAGRKGGNARGKKA